MARSPESLAVDATYLEFFGLARPPFGELAHPDEQFQSEQHLLLMEHLEFAAANADSLVVVRGADGSGKSTLISRFIGAIQDQVCCALIDAASNQGVVPFYRTFLQQIGFDQITGTANELANITKEFLVCRGMARDHVLVIIDNTHLADPRILEQLQRLCGVRIRDRRAISVVLFGNADIVRVVDAPAMRQTVFAHHVVFNIRSYSEHDTAGYIRHRLELAGAGDGLMFPDAVCSLIHRYSGGIPRWISKLGADALEEAHRQNSRTVSTDIIRAVINKQRLLPHITPLAARGRRRSDPRTEPRGSQERTAELAAQIDRIEASRSQALRELDERNGEIQSLREELDARRKEAESFSRSAASHAAVIARQEQALSERAGLLKQSQSEVRRLTSELSTELRSREAAQERLDKANSAIVELTRSGQELQATLNAVEAELRNGRSAAGQRALDTEALERTTVHLKAQIAAKTAELESLRSELASRNAAVADLELRLESQSRADHAAAITQQNQALSESTAALQASEIRAKHLAAELSNELRSRDAALERLDKANAAVAELTRSRDGLQETVDALKGTIDHLRVEIAGQTAELDSMRVALASRNAAVAELEVRLEVSRSECEAAKSHIATLKDPAAFQALEQLVQRLESDLETEREARTAADKRRDEAAAAAQRLREHEEELQATARKLDAELKASRERAFAAYALESYVTDLQKALEARTSELNERTQAVADLEGQVGKLRNECESLRNRAVAAKPADSMAPRPARTEPTAGDRTYSSHVVALYERSLTGIPAYRMLKEHDPVFYDGLINEYQVLTGQGLSDEQVNDALRAIQAKWMERQLSRTSDRTIATYARLLVDQLDEFLLDGVEPCLSMLIPKPKPVKGVVPGYSRRTGERELDLLNMVLTTYDANRTLPQENDVWPDLEPIFVELFDSFGADNVAAIENSFDPGMDRSLLCNVSRTLFTRVLALPEPKAAAALRWMLISK